MSEQGQTLDLVAERRRARAQTLTTSAWAIREVLDEQQAAALAEITQASRTGASTAPGAAKLAVLEELRFAFTAHLTKEGTSHA
jgi:hypothetical protein